jgi:hypothetical protein
MDHGPTVTDAVPLKRGRIGMAVALAANTTQGAADEARTPKRSRAMEVMR